MERSLIEPNKTSLLSPHDAEPVTRHQWAELRMFKSELDPVKMNVRFQKRKKNVSCICKVSQHADRATRIDGPTGLGRDEVRCMATRRRRRRRRTLVLTWCMSKLVFITGGNRFLTWSGHTGSLDPLIHISMRCSILVSR